MPKTLKPDLRDRCWVELVLPEGPWEGANEVGLAVTNWLVSVGQDFVWPLRGQEQADSDLVGATSPAALARAFRACKPDWPLVRVPMEVRSPEWQSQRAVLIGLLPGGSAEDQRERLEGLLGELRSKAPGVEVRMDGLIVSKYSANPIGEPAYLEEQSQKRA